MPDAPAQAGAVTSLPSVTDWSAAMSAYVAPAKGD